MPLLRTFFRLGFFLANSGIPSYFNQNHASLIHEFMLKNLLLFFDTIM